MFYYLCSTQSYISIIAQRDNKFNLKPSNTIQYVTDKAYNSRPRNYIRFLYNTVYTLKTT